MNHERRLILGTVQFGLPYGINNTEGQPSTEASFRILDAAWEAGIRILDSASGYGTAQQVIGTYIRETGRAFDVNTKFRVDGTSIREQLTQSLQDLSIEKAKVLFFHRFEEMTEAPLKELALLREEGLIEQAGVSIYTNTELEAAVNENGVDVIQLPFNLLDNASQRGELLLAAQAAGKEIQIRSVFLQGLFFRPLENFSPKLEPLKTHVATITAIAEKAGMSMEELAMAYVLGKNYIDGVLIGVDSPAQLARNLDAAARTLPTDIEKELDAIVVRETELLYPYNWT